MHLIDYTFNKTFLGFVIKLVWFEFCCIYTFWPPACGISEASKQWIVSQSSVDSKLCKKICFSHHNKLVCSTVSLVSGYKILWNGWIALRQQQIHVYSRRLLIYFFSRLLYNFFNRLLYIWLFLKVLWYSCPVCSRLT